MPDSNSSAQPSDSILIIDFGSQVTQLIARRVREAGVYSEIAPFNNAEAAFARMQPKGIILSGGPASTTHADSPRAPQCVFDSGLPILGICYGQQTMMMQLGGHVRAGDGGEFGRASIAVEKPCALFDGLWESGETHQVWMSHGDKVTSLAPGFEVVATSDGAPYAFIADEARQYYGIQFHPEVVHTPDGAKLISSFVRNVCGLAGDWTMAEFRATKIAEIRAQVGSGRVICGLSGGVDSSVAAILIHEAIGAQLTCVFVDHGLLRMNEREQVETLFRDHYNIEPLRELFKDEVRVLGRELGLNDQFVGRHPFPGPGLAIRIPGEVTKERCDVLRKADAVYLEEIRNAGLYDAIWQAFAVLLPVRTVGVMGDSRTYDNVCALRAVTSTDGMTADIYPFESAFLSRVSTRIINEVKGINRVVYDYTSKPPGTIEWE